MWQQTAAPNKAGRGETRLSDLRNLERRIRSLGGLPQGLREFYLSVFTVQLQALDQLAGLDGLWLVPTREKFRACRDKGEPLMAGRLPPLVAGAVGKTAMELVAAVERHGFLVTRRTRFWPAPPCLSERVLGYIDHLVKRYGLAVWRMPPEEREKAAEMPEAVLAFAALAPAYARYAKLVEQNYDLSTWTWGRCPVCGLSPMMAKQLPEGGKRVAECWLCAAEWPISSLRCPFCGNGDPDRLCFIGLEENPATRAQLCRQCRGYLKVVNVARAEEPPILALENLAGWRLDRVAYTGGYLPGCGGVVLPGFPRF